MGNVIVELKWHVTLVWLPFLAANTTNSTPISNPIQPTIRLTYSHIPYYKHLRTIHKMVEYRVLHTHCKYENRIFSPLMLNLSSESHILNITITIITGDWRQVKVIQQVFPLVEKRKTEEGNMVTFFLLFLNISLIIKPSQLPTYFIVSHSYFT